jgi:Predicted membrane protein (DUF2069)
VPLRRAIVGCHLLLIAALAASLVPPTTALRLCVAVLLALPLLLTLRGLTQGRRTTLQRLAVLLVPYIGGLSVEVVARSGNAPSLSLALIAAVLELGLLLALIRGARSAP